MKTTDGRSGQFAVTVRTVTPREARALLVQHLPADVADDLVRQRATADKLSKVLNDFEREREGHKANRLVTASTWEKYARDMANDRWLDDGATIKIDTSGWVRDGWHRLLAVVRSGKQRSFAVATGVDPNAQLVTDTGRSRTTADQLRLLGHVSPNHLAAAAALLIRWRNGKMLLSTFQPSVSEISEFTSKTPELIEGIRVANAIRYGLPRTPFSVVAAVYTEATTVDTNARDEFFESLRTGEDLTSGSPILALRLQIIRYETNRGRVDTRTFNQAQKLFHAIRAWNGWRKNETLRTLRVPTNLTSDSFTPLV